MRMIEKSVVGFGLVFLWLVFGALSCSDSGKSQEEQGDADELAESAEVDESGYDMGTPPEKQTFAWSGENLGVWTETPFCYGGIALLAEDFEDGSIDEELKAHELDGQSYELPVLLEEEGGNHYASGAPGDMGEDKEFGVRLDWLRTAGMLVDALRISSRLPNSESANAVELTSPSMSGQALHLRIEHLGSRPEGWDTTASFPLIRVLDPDGEDLLDPPIKTPSGWVVIELYRISTTRWRLDVNRYQSAEFDSFMSPSDDDDGWLRLEGTGHFDELSLKSSCDIPEEMFLCESASDCRSDMVCGRDKVCHESRSITCEATTICAGKEDTECIGEKDGASFLGDGACVATCTGHEDCRPYEVCVPESTEAAWCRTFCHADDDCPEGQQCLDSFGVGGCTPTNCRDNGEPFVQVDGLWGCRCKEGASLDPVTNACEAGDSCAEGEDCSQGSQCQADVCESVRDTFCYADEDCPQGASCWGHKLETRMPMGGVCLQPCYSNDPCRDYERCWRGEYLEWSCVATCLADEDCAEGLACIQAGWGYSEGWCLPPVCIQNGSWSWSVATNGFVCVCDSGYRRDTATGRCVQ